MRSGVAVAAVVAVLGLEAPTREGAGRWPSTRWESRQRPQGFARAVALLPAVLSGGCAYSCDHDRRASIDPSLAIALVPGISQAAIAVDKSRDSSRQKPR